MSEPCASGGALSRVPLKMPGQPMTALVHLKDQVSYWYCTFALYKTAEGEARAGCGVVE